MTITIKIITAGAAFEDDPDELSRILHELAESAWWQPRDTVFNHPVHDINGNKVGHFRGEPGTN